MMLGNRKFIIATVISLFLALPVFAVFTERDLEQTLSVLRFELEQQYGQLMSGRNDRSRGRDESQHREMVEMIKKCNELSLMLYSQNQDYTFDMTYALKEVSKEYEDFNTRRMPYDRIISQIDVEIDRYSRLVAALKRLPAPGEKMPAPPRDSIDFLQQIPDSLRRAIMPDQADRPAQKVRPFLLSEKGLEDRDSCIFYAQSIVDMYTTDKARVIVDNEHYESASARLKESYDYAQERYRLLQQRMFTQSQDPYLSILKHPASYVREAFDEARLKYNRRMDEGPIKSEWRGPVVFGFIILVLLALALSSALSLFFVSLIYRKSKAFQNEANKKRRGPVTLFLGSLLFFIVLSVIALTTENHFFHQATDLLLIFCWLLMAILASIIIRLKPEKLSEGFSLYMPAIVAGLVVITFRAIFIPNKMMNILFPPLLICFVFWQASAFRRHAKKVDLSDDIVSCITLVVFVGTAVLSCLGFVFLALLFIIWWLFLLAAAESLMALLRIFRLVRDRRLNVKLNGYSSKLVLEKSARGEYIRLTWPYDLVGGVVLPVLAVLSLPASAYTALQVFDLQEIFHGIYYAEFFDLTSTKGNEILKVSANMLVIVTALFFVFRYVSYFVRSMYRDIMYRKIREAEGNRHIRTNEVNLTLANNVIRLLVWGIYVILIFALFRIPTGAVSVVFAGLATGLGLAMRDVLNNFIYGIQLMSGRLRVGDWVECDGIRGKVTAISDQSTQIETLDSAVMSFPNTALFNKNFKNLTRNNPYESVKIVVGVKYGSDIEAVRALLVQAMETLRTDDEYGQKILDEKNGVTVVFDDFGDSSVNLAVRQHVLVSQRSAYIARAKELIYNTLQNNGIDIPYPQRDIHVISEK